jgi:hypothetical protein
VPNVGGEGAMAPGLPRITPWLVPLDLETLRIVWPTALSVAFVGLLETLLTAKLVDELTDTRSHKGRESWALGIANIAAAFYGGIAGCAMIGQTVVNVKIGRARTRVSTAVAALVLLLLVTGLSGLMAQIPMVALAAVMMIVALKTINWHSVQPATLKRMPIPETRSWPLLSRPRSRPAISRLASPPAFCSRWCCSHAGWRTSFAPSARSATTGCRFATMSTVHCSSAAATTSWGAFAYLIDPKAGRDRSHAFPDLGCLERRGAIGFRPVAAFRLSLSRSERNDPVMKAEKVA